MIHPDTLRSLLLISSPDLGFRGKRVKARKGELKIEQIGVIEKEESEKGRAVI